MLDHRHGGLNLDLGIIVDRAAEKTLRSPFGAKGTVGLKREARRKRGKPCEGLPRSARRKSWKFS